MKFKVHTLGMKPLQFIWQNVILKNVSMVSQRQILTLDNVLSVAIVSNETIQQRNIELHVI